MTSLIIDSQLHNTVVTEKMSKTMKQIKDPSKQLANRSTHRLIQRYDKNVLEDVKDFIWSIRNDQNSYYKSSNLLEFAFFFKVIKGQQCLRFYQIAN